MSLRHSANRTINHNHSHFKAPHRFAGEGCSVSLPLFSLWLGLAYHFPSESPGAKPTSTMCWKRSQKRAVQLAWQNIYKSLILLIPSPVDVVQRDVAYNCVRMKGAWEDRGVLSLCFPCGQNGRTQAMLECSSAALKGTYVGAILDSWGKF